MFGRNMFLSYCLFWVERETYCCLCGWEGVFLGHGFVGGLWEEVDVLWGYGSSDLIDFKAPSSLS